MRTRWLFFAVGILAIPIAMSSAQVTNVARVMAIRGSAYYSEPAAPENWKPLRCGQALRQGDALKTKAGSQVDLFLKENGPVVRVAADTILVLRKLTFLGNAERPIVETRMELKRGRIQANVRRRAKESVYEVKLPTGRIYDLSATSEVYVRR